MEQCSESGGSEINWPPGVGSGFEFVRNIRFLIILSNIQKIVRKRPIFEIIYNIYYLLATKCAGRIRIGIRN